MAQMTITHTVSDFCFTTGVTEIELQEIVGLGVVVPQLNETQHWIFVEGDITIVHRAARLRRELALDWPGVAIVLTLLDENRQLRHENLQLQQRLTRFLSR